jgi:hypothetical protein
MAMTLLVCGNWNWNCADVRLQLREVRNHYDRLASKIQNGIEEIIENARDYESVAPNHKVSVAYAVWEHESCFVHILRAFSAVSSLTLLTHTQDITKLQVNLLQLLEADKVREVRLAIVNDVLGQLRGGATFVSQL